MNRLSIEHVANLFSYLENLVVYYHNDSESISSNRFTINRIKSKVKVVNGLSKLLYTRFDGEFLYENLVDVFNFKLHDDIPDNDKYTIPDFTVQLITVKNDISYSYTDYENRVLYLCIPVKRFSSTTVDDYKFWIEFIYLICENYKSKYFPAVLFVKKVFDEEKGFLERNIKGLVNYLGTITADVSNYVSGIAATIIVYERYIDTYCEYELTINMQQAIMSLLQKLEYGDPKMYNYFSTYDRHTSTSFFAIGERYALDSNFTVTDYEPEVESKDKETTE